MATKHIIVQNTESHPKPLRSHLSGLYGSNTFETGDSFIVFSRNDDEAFIGDIFSRSETFNSETLAEIISDFVTYLEKTGCSRVSVCVDGLKPRALELVHAAQKLDFIPQDPFNDYLVFLKELEPNGLCN
ncbi:MAG: hypothetical protein AB7G93_15205 [Bdellovibrionales bacterium]